MRTSRLASFFTPLVVAILLIGALAGCGPHSAAPRNATSTVTQADQEVVPSGNRVDPAPLPTGTVPTSSPTDGSDVTQMEQQLNDVDSLLGQVEGLSRMDQ